MEKRVISIFGESEKGEYEKFYPIADLAEAFEILGSPPKETEALQFSLQILGASQPILFFRVKEEGFSFDSYAKGIELLKVNSGPFTIQALFMPGLSDPNLIEKAREACEKHQAVLLITDKDFQDYKYS